MANLEQTPCHDPGNGELLGYSALNEISDVAVAVRAARKAQARWAALSFGQRARHVKAIRRHLVDNADSIAETIARDNGKTRTDALLAEVVSSALACGYYARTASKHLADQRPGPATLLLANKRATIRRMPWGVVGIISPWNYPMAIPFAEIIMALMAGNAVLFKTATETQMVGRAIEAAVKAADLPEGLFTYLNLPGRVAGDAFLEAGIDKLFFTGSVGVGKVLMAKAAETLTPVVLELGGNDAMLVCGDADLERAAAGAVWAGLSNCGQTCGGVERIYVQRQVYEPFLDILGRRVAALRVGYDTDFNVDLGAMTTTRQMKTVRGHIDDALARGARIHTQSECPSGPGNFMPATVLVDVDHDMAVMREETFGPVLAVMAVDNMDQAVELANNSDLGLTGSVWSKNRREADGLARRIMAGVVMVNDHLMSHGLHETPWGGFKNSGIGSTHGRLGMLEMTQPHCVVHDYMPGVRKDMWWHPHGRQEYLGLRAVLEFLYGPGLGTRLRGAMRTLRLMRRSFKP